MGDEAIAGSEIEVDPYHPGPANARLRRSGVPVWAVVGYYLYAAEKDEGVVARDYDLSAGEVRAALRYYRKHRPEIDGRIADNRPVSAG